MACRFIMMDTRPVKMCTKPFKEPLANPGKTEMVVKFLCEHLSAFWTFVHNNVQHLQSEPNKQNFYLYFSMYFAILTI